jgi:hypothetical protein
MSGSRYGTDGRDAHESATQAPKIMMARLASSRAGAETRRPKRRKAAA